MTEDELIGKLKAVQKMKSESNTLELKSAENGCPQHLYDSLSSFSNQDEGGIIIFGITVYAVWAVRKVRRDRKNGSCCGGSCSGCIGEKYCNK